MGNAKYTPSHLHFGIYTNEGAVDPLPFVERRSEEAPAIALPLSRLNDTLRLNRNSAPFNTGEPVFVHAISANRYKVSGVTGREAWINAAGLNPVKNDSRKITIRTAQSLYDKPDTAAARITALKPGATLSVLGSYLNFELVRSGAFTGWVSKR
jgi:hypothetical protein